MFTTILTIIFLVSAILYLLVFLRRRQTLDPKNKVVLISGCDTGMGNSGARKLSSLGCTVLAGCFTDAGIEEMSKIKNVVAFKLDITQQKSVENSFEIAKKHCPNGLWALINNAGICKWGYMDMVSMDDYRKTMEVNYFGHIAMIKQHLPLLKKAKGRIISTTSMADFVGLSGFSTYCASKFALRGFMESIRLELGVWGISVSIVEPGGTITALTASIAKALNVEGVRAAFSKEAFDLYGEEYFTKKFSQMLEPSGQGFFAAGHPDRIGDVYAHATLSCLPKAYYRVGNDVVLFWILNLLPAWIHDKREWLENGSLKPKGAL